MDAQTIGWALYAWCISVPSANGAAPSLWPVEAIISAQLLAMIDTQATRKFIIHSNDREDKLPGILVCDLCESMIIPASDLLRSYGFSPLIYTILTLVPRASPYVR